MMLGLECMVRRFLVRVLIVYHSLKQASKRMIISAGGFAHRTPWLATMPFTLILAKNMIWEIGKYDMIGYDDMIWYGMIWYVMIWYHIIWYDRLCYDMIWTKTWYSMFQKITKTIKRNRTGSKKSHVPVPSLSRPRPSPMSRARTLALAPVLARVFELEHEL